jgi:hypothetical protein
MTCLRTSGDGASHTFPPLRDTEMTTKRPLPARIGLAAAYAAGIAALGLVLGSGVIRCPFASLTHHPCPGCGSTRSVLALLSLHFGEAFRLNPAAPVIAVSTGVVILDGLFRVLRDGHAKDLGMTGPARWALRALVIATVLEVPIWALRFFGLFGGPVPV